MNRMPQPGQGNPGQGYPPYPGQSGYPQTGGYPQQQYPNGQRYPVGQYPGYQNYPNQNHRGYAYNTNSVYRKNGCGIGQSASFTMVSLISLLLILVNRS